MTTRVDPRPHAAPTDLVTAADVARWLDERAMASPPEPVPQYSRHWILELAWADLHARLDRERRQACRRGALGWWRAACRIMRAAQDRRGRKRDELLTAAVWGQPLYPWGPWSEDDRLARSLLDHLSRALAFRAAARQP